MHFVILVVLLATVYGRDISHVGYYPAQPNERYNRQHSNSPLPEVNERRYEGIDPNRGNYGGRPVDLNHNGQPVSNEYSRDLSNDRNGRRRTDRVHRGATNDMDVNLGFERLDTKRHRDGNLNLPKQSFNVNNEYAKKDDVTTNDNNRSINFNLPAPREESDMVFRNDDEDDHNKRNVAMNPNKYLYNNRNNNVPKVSEHNTNNNPNSDVSKIGIISFAGTVNNNGTNKHFNRNKENKTQYNESNNKYYIQNGFKSDTASNTDQKPLKTTIENEVTSNPFLRNPILKENKTVEGDIWVWDWDDSGKTQKEEATTVPTTQLVTLDDRAAFDGDKCATGMARVAGKCVVKD